MSHISKVRGMAITDRAAIEAAVTNLIKAGKKVELLKDSKPRMWNRQQTEQVGICDYVIALPNTRFDVGLKWNHKEEQFDVFFDEWDSFIKDEIGIDDRTFIKAFSAPNTTQKRLQHIAGFMKEYTMQMVLNQVDGYVVNEVTLADGGKQIILESNAGVDTGNGSINTYF